VARMRVLCAKGEWYRHCAWMLRQLPLRLLQHVSALVAHSPSPLVTYVECSKIWCARKDARPEGMLVRQECALLVLSCSQVPRPPVRKRLCLAHAWRQFARTGKLLLACFTGQPAFFLVFGSISLSAPQPHWWRTRMEWQRLLLVCITLLGHST
jgi:hypothetical protein